MMTQQKMPGVQTVKKCEIKIHFISLISMLGSLLNESRFLVKSQLEKMVCRGMAYN